MEGIVMSMTRFIITMGGQISHAGLIRIHMQVMIGLEEVEEE
jgi:hypothetical protein